MLSGSMRVTVLICLGVLLGACDDDPVAPPAPTPASVHIDPQKPTLTALGDSVSLSAVVTDQNGNPISDVPILWESADPDRVEVTPQGVAIARGNGSATVTARAGGAAGTTTVVVEQRVSQIRFLTHPDRQLSGRPLSSHIEVVVEDARGALVTTYTEPITLSLAPSGSLKGSTTATPNGGMAVFTELQIDEPRREYRLVAETGDVAPSMSDPFDVHVALVQVRAGGSHNCGLTADGQAYCWGQDHGRPEDGTIVGRHAPQRVQGQNAFTFIHAGSSGTWALTADGTAFRWGQSGNLAPVALHGTRRYGFMVSRSFSCGLTLEGRAYCWGVPTSVFGAGSSNGQFVTEPTLAMGGATYTAIGVASYATCALDVDGRVWCSGQNHYGELGNGTTSWSTLRTEVAGGLRFTALSVGLNFACGIATDGQTYCWGSNLQLQLGNVAGGTLSAVPLAISGSYRFTSVSAGTWHACGIEADGAAACWGYDSEGQLGRGALGPIQPGPRAVLGGHQFRSISAGSFHTCGIAYDDFTYCWGSNTVGQLGTGGGPNRTVPTLVTAPQP